MQQGLPSALPLDADASLNNTAHTKQNGDTPSEQNGTVNASESAITNINGSGHGLTPGSRGKKRKLDEAEQLKYAKRGISPPWKRFEVDGPATFVDTDGRRKSSRTNTQPASQASNGGKKKSRSSQQNKGTRRSGRVAANAPTPDTSTKASRGNHQPKLVNGHGARSAAHNGPRNSARLPRNQPQQPRQHYGGRRSGASRALDKAGGIDYFAGPTTHTNGRTAGTVRHPRIKLNYRPPPLPILHFGQVPRPKKYNSLAEHLANDDPLAGEEDQPWSPEKIRSEASALNHVLEAGRAGGLLSQTRLQAWRQREDLAERPENDAATPYTHPDYLAKQLEDLHMRIQREAKEHRALAKRIATAAAAAGKKRLPETEQERIERIVRESKNLLRMAMRELDRQWARKKSQIDAMKVQEYEEQRDEAARQQMRGWLERSEKRVAERQNILLSDFHDVNISELEDAGSGTDSEDGNSSDDEGDTQDDDMNFSSSSTSQSEADESGEEDDELDIEQLKRKYANIDDQPSDQLHTHDDRPSDQLPMHNDHPSNRHPQHDDTPDDRLTAEELRAKYANLPDLSDNDDRIEDASPDDSDDYGSSDESDGTPQPSTDEESDAESEDEAEEGLIGFLGQKERSALLKSEQASEHVSREASLDISGATETNGVVMNGDVPHGPNANIDLEVKAEHSEGELQQLSHSTSPVEPATTDGRDEPLKSAEAEAPRDVSSTENVGEPGSIKLAPPALLRGQLRMYQQYGLEWLAGMYLNETNGILADEMGLGKTIQTISLLAWLACERHIWGPHLIVVPTSVLMNWEMEFKKFCPGFKILTYYGTQDERSQKRKGWMDETKWHVCITSYQLAVSDAAVLKRRNWHYLILDEAHNIKNFRSQRWQTLLSFKTQARLLLTGTPLQNNLTELWSLLFFLSPQINEKGETEFGELAEFSKNFNKPVEQILNHGRDSMDDEAKNVVIKLHKVLRPHLLRRLKKDVEKQMPKKYEHVTLCRLSKRQRQLYDGYMRRADTRESFGSGNYMSIINCLMQLRKVCNHPDLFETRQIVTSYAMKEPVARGFESREQLVRRYLLGQDNKVQERTSIINLWEAQPKYEYTRRVRHDPAVARLREEVQVCADSVSESPEFNGQTMTSALDVLKNVALHSKLDYRQRQLDTTFRFTSRRPLYRQRLMEMLTIDSSVKRQPPRRSGLAEAYFETTSVLDKLILSLPDRAASMDLTVQKFACITPAVVTHGMAPLALTKKGVEIVQEVTDVTPPTRMYHEAQTRLSIAFPDRALIQYDCGKLQQLDKLLRTLQTGGHRALIFTQMTKVLDILEQFLNLHGHRYLRLDGSTKIEQRLALTERFNNDTRILVFIASSRSGGLGINLTGADTVIFYDLDWNPAMDKQCQDRCHRIGQTRDVHIYRFVCEGTIEANILRKSNQKRMLDDVVIQEGDFTTDYFNQLDKGDIVDDGSYGDSETNAALDKVFGGMGQDQAMERVFEQAEDKEDRDAAQKAEKEDVQMDGEDFEDRLDKKPTSTQATGTPRSSEAPATPTEGEKSAIPSSSASPAPLPQDTPSASSPAAAAPPETSDVEMANVDADDDATAADDDDEEEDEEPDMAPLDLARPIHGIGDWMLDYLKWELRDVKYLPPSERARKKAKKGRDFGIPRIRR